MWPCNEESVLLFWNVRRQWQFRPDGRVLGIRLEAIESAMRIRRTEDQALQLDRLQRMESAALEVISG